ncbi:6065_t:CDS:2, partial [Racocetra persica]
EVYRGAYPKSRNYRFLKRLKLKTMLSLIPDPPVRELLEFCQSQNIRNIHLQVGKKKDNDVSLIYSKAIQSVQIIIDPSNLPIFIHCLDGANVTGLVVACLRKLQMWSIPSCMGEFLRYLRGGVISSEESEFIEKFSGEIGIPSTIPHWLWGGHVTSNKHPTLKLKFLDPRVIEQFEQKKKNGKSIEVDNKDDYCKRVN